MIISFGVLDSTIRLCFIMFYATIQLTKWYECTYSGLGQVHCDNKHLSILPTSRFCFPFYGTCTFFADFSTNFWPKICAKMSWTNLHQWNLSENTWMDSCILYHIIIYIYICNFNCVICVYCISYLKKNYVHILIVQIDPYISMTTLHQLVKFHFRQETLDKSCNAPEATAFFASLGLCCTARKIASCGGKFYTGARVETKKDVLRVRLVGIW